MKKTLNFLQYLTIILITTALLSFVTDNGNYQIECVSFGSDGYLTIKIWDTKQGTNYKEEQARKDAIHCILYSGISSGNNCVNQKPLLVDQENQTNFEKIDKKFFGKDGDWPKFVHNSDKGLSSPKPIKSKDGKIYFVSVSINLLRIYLEQNKIIKPLNSGF